MKDGFSCWGQPMIIYNLKLTVWSVKTKVRVLYNLEVGVFRGGNQLFEQTYTELQGWQAHFASLLGCHGDDANQPLHEGNIVIVLRLNIGNLTVTVIWSSVLLFVFKSKLPCRYLQGIVLVKNTSNWAKTSF